MNITQEGEELFKAKVRYPYWLTEEEVEHINKIKEELNERKDRSNTNAGKQDPDKA